MGSNYIYYCASCFFTFIVLKIFPVSTKLPRLNNGCTAFYFINVPELIIHSLVVFIGYYNFFLLVFLLQTLLQ